MAKIWGVIPAAGIGSRMQSDRPKQYLSLGGQLVIEHSIGCISPHVSAIVVALANHDDWWTFPANDQLHSCSGGAERVDSVLNALGALIDIGATDGDWVLVHDAARPLVPEADIIKLVQHIQSGETSPVILATAVSDTVKRSLNGVTVSETLDRNQLWRALTPQAAPIGILRKALSESLAAGVPVTDESSALERQGHSPKIIPGSPWNIKITVPTDLQIADVLFKSKINL